MFASVTQTLARGAKRLRSLDRFSRNESAATAVEFALVAAPFLALLIAIFQTAMVFFAGRVLDETVEEASRVILTGQAQTSSMTQSQFADWVCQNTSSFFTCSKFMINVQNYSSFASANTSAPTLNINANGDVTNQWNFNMGNAGDIVIVQVMYQWPVALGPLGFNLSNLSNGNRLLMSVAAFKNEPY
jgi:Flp pilus assembly protein TadG